VSHHTIRDLKLELNTGEKVLLSGWVEADWDYREGEPTDLTDFSVYVHFYKDDPEVKGGIKISGEVHLIYDGYPFIYNLLTAVLGITVHDLDLVMQAPEDEEDAVYYRQHHDDYYPPRPGWTS